MYHVVVMMPMCLILKKHIATFGSKKIKLMACFTDYFLAFDLFTCEVQVIVL